MRYAIAGLDAADALALSRRLWDLFLPAINLAPKEWRFTYERLLDEIARKHIQVWVVVDLVNDDIVAGLITAIMTYSRFPGVIMLEIPLVAGKGMREWIGPALRYLNSWGMEHKADIMVAYGRKGWERVAGFEYHSEDEAGIRIMTRPIGGIH